MRISYIHSDEQPLQSRFEIRTEDTDDIFNVKSLPGRWYDTAREVWIVPITIGLAIALEKSNAPISGELLGLVQLQEAALLASLVAEPEKMTIAKMDKIGTDEAIRAAFANHYLKDHHGDDNEYLAVHREVMTAPEVKPNKRRKKSEREIKDKQIRTGRID